MKRLADALTSRAFDALFIGGHILGVCAAGGASLRGLSLAFIEPADVGSDASAYSFKMLRSGIRHLQHTDLGRLHITFFECGAMLKLAPHLAHPTGAPQAN
jgi:glycerol-3-phosphate dehydrogenase